MDKPVSHTNRKGKTYYLHAVTRKTGKTGYAMKSIPEGALTDMPEGYVISEGVNGEVSVGRPAPREITELEEALVASKLKELGLQRYRHQIKGAYITIYEPNMGELELREMYADFTVLNRTAMERHIENRLDTSSVSPVMRFQIVDKSKRGFQAERMTYRGNCGWRWLGRAAPLAALLDTYLPHLGKESFFELL